MRIPLNQAVIWDNDVSGCQFEFGCWSESIIYMFVPSTNNDYSFCSNDISFYSFIFKPLIPLFITMDDLYNFIWKIIENEFSLSWWVQLGQIYIEQWHFWKTFPLLSQRVWKDELWYWWYRTSRHFILTLLLLSVTSQCV